MSVQCIAVCYGNMCYWQGEGIVLNNTANNTTNSRNWATTTIADFKMATAW